MLMLRSRGASFTGAALLALAGACSSTDAPMPTGPVSSLRASFSQSEGRGVFQRYVAIGTSVSMGWQSDGVIAATQATSWPAQLAALGGRVLEQPYIAGTGCTSPLIAPLASGLRLSGEPASANKATLRCSPLQPGVRLPVANVALSGARTRDALVTTPENITDLQYVGLYHRVLEPGHTQVSTMLEQNPKLVSVEFGANEVLGATSGVAVPGASMELYQVWQPLYDRLLDQVQSVSKMAVLVGLMGDVRNFPAFRAGSELWADRAEFLGANIAVSPDCQNSANIVFLPVRIAVALATATQMARQQLGQYVLSCTASPSPFTQDFILTPAEADVVNALMHQMSAHIQAEAARRGFAYFDLGALYDRADLKAPFSLGVMLGSPTPFGSYISLDGLHPSAAGSRVLALAAAHALNVTYKLGIPE